MSRTRRHRRGSKQVIKHGHTAKRPHKHIGGRTGQIMTRNRRGSK